MKRAAAGRWTVAALAASAAIAIAAAFVAPAFAQARHGAGASPAAPQALATAAEVQVKVTVVPSRLIVVDENERIVDIYSNTRAAAEGTYTLHIREGGAQGPEIGMTPKIQAEYAALLAKVDWTRTGRVYGK